MPMPKMNGLIWLFILLRVENFSSRTGHFFNPSRTDKAFSFSELKVYVYHIYQINAKFGTAKDQIVGIFRMYVSLIRDNLDHFVQFEVYR